MKSLLSKLNLALVVLMSGVACASEEGGHHGLSTDAPVLWNIDLPFWPGHSLPITNSMVMMTIAVVLLTIILRLATRKMQSVPGGLQNFVCTNGKVASPQNLRCRAQVIGA